MTKMTYREQLLHPNWQRKRLEVLSSAGFECSNCGDKESTLHVHHRRYVKGRMAWEYDNAELECLCEKCHSIRHTESEVLAKLLAGGVGRTAKAIALVLGSEDAEYSLQDGEQLINLDQCGSPNHLAAYLGSLMVDALTTSGGPEAILGVLRLLDQHPTVKSAVELVRTFVVAPTGNDVEGQAE